MPCPNNKAITLLSHHLSAHLTVLAGCALVVYLQVGSLRARSREGLDEYSLMSQDSNPGLKSNAEFVYVKFVATQAVYGGDVFFLQFSCLVCLSALVWWSPLVAGELFLLQRLAHVDATRRPWQIWLLRCVRVLIFTLCGAMIAGAWVARLPLLLPGVKSKPPPGLSMAAGSSARKPNLLFILADDMRAIDPFVDVDAASPQGGISRLRARGIAFENAHAPSLKCSPSRTAILTGRSVAVSGLRHDLHSMVWRHFMPGVMSLPEALKQTGHWRVESSGKIWHSRANIAVEEREFDRVFGGDGDYSTHYGHPMPFCDDIEENIIFVTNSNMKKFGTCNGPMADQRVVDWARARLREHAAAPRSDDAKALALFVGLKQTHLPWYSPKSSLDHDLTAALADALVRELNTTTLIGEAASVARDQCNGIFSDHVRPRGAAFVQRFAQNWAATHAHADEMIGRLLDELEASSLASSTVVVFTSDHGFHVGERDHVYKNTLWRVTTHVPLVIAVPPGASANMPLGAKRGVRSDPVSLLDLFPTVLQALDAETADATRERGLAGRNILTSQWEAVISTHVGHPSWEHSFMGAHSLSSTDARFISYDAWRDDPAAEELYDVAVDPGERRNLGASDHPWRRRLRDALATGGVGFAGGSQPLLSAVERFAQAPLLVDYLLLPAWVVAVLLPLFVVPIGACCCCAIKSAGRVGTTRAVRAVRTSLPIGKVESSQRGAEAQQPLLRVSHSSR